jgi:hypothetical protein
MARKKATSDWRSNWTAIRSVSPKSGLAGLTRDFERDKSDASTALDLVAARMWLSQYESAERICAEAESARSKTMFISAFPVQRGAALWCLGRHQEARRTWWQAAKAKYGDSGGANVHYLLLLFADALLTGADSTRPHAEMENKTADHRAQGMWPGPLTMFLLGIYGASFLTDMADDRVSRWQFDFYQAVKTFAVRGQQRAMNNEMSLLLSRVQNEPDLEAFVDYARLPEVHLARAMPRIHPPLS